MSKTSVGLKQALIRWGEVPTGNSKEDCETALLYLPCRYLTLKPKRIGLDPWEPDRLNIPIYTSGALNNGKTN